MSAEIVGIKFITWASKRSDVSVVLLIGSRALRKEEYGYADGYSDWDFQVVTTKCGIFSDGRWLAEAGLGEPLAYVARVGRLGGSIKASISVADGELDIVIIPARHFWFLVILNRFGLEKALARTAQGVRDLSMVWRRGVVVVKGSSEVERFVREVRKTGGAGRLDDNAIVQIAEGFVCDYISIRRKLRRGEYIAAQRWLHVQLAEANFVLLHELRQRGGVISFPDARRAESYLSEEEINQIQIRAHPDKRSIESALYKSANACVMLVNALVQGRWHWPELPSSLRIEELRDDVL